MYKLIFFSENKVKRNTKVKKTKQTKLFEVDLITLNKNDKEMFHVKVLLLLVLSLRLLLFFFWCAKMISCPFNISLFVKFNTE